MLAGIGEIVGWAGRLWSTQTFLAGGEDPYIMQLVLFIIMLAMSEPAAYRICATIIAPTPLLAANFVILGLIIGHLGAQYSRLTPKWCKYLSLTSAK